MGEGERRLAAVMFTDIVGYTSQAQKDEARALRMLEEHRKVVRPSLPRHHGKEIKTIGDSFLLNPSVVLGKKILRDRMML